MFAVILRGIKIFLSTFLCYLAPGRPGVIVVFITDFVSRRFIYANWI